MRTDDDAIKAMTEFKKWLSNLSVKEQRKIIDHLYNINVLKEEWGYVKVRLLGTGAGGNERYDSIKGKVVLSRLVEIKSRSTGETVRKVFCVKCKEINNSETSYLLDNLRADTKGDEVVLPEEEIPFFESDVEILGVIGES